MVIKSCPLLVKDTETCVGSSLASYFVLVSFYFVFISLISFRFVSFLLISFRFVSFRFALYRYPEEIVGRETANNFLWMTSKHILVLNKIDAIQVVQHIVYLWLVFNWKKKKKKILSNVNWVHTFLLFLSIKNKIKKIWLKWSRIAFIYRIHA